MTQQAFFKIIYTSRCDFVMKLFGYTEAMNITVYFLIALTL
jgi:hypothetical protein